MHFERQSAIDAKAAFEDIQSRISTPALAVESVRNNISLLKGFIDACIREAPATSDHSKELSKQIKDSQAEAKDGKGKDDGKEQ